MRERLLQWLAARFPGSEAELEVLPGGRITGQLVWDGFADTDHRARQQSLAAAVRETFDRAEQLQLGAILTFTPDEVAIMRAD